MDQVEKYIMTRLYKSVFCPETTDDEKKDLATQNRIRSAPIHSNQAVNNIQCTFMQTGFCWETGLLVFVIQGFSLILNSLWNLSVCRQSVCAADYTIAVFSSVLFVFLTCECTVAAVDCMCLSPTREPTVTNVFGYIISIKKTKLLTLTNTTLSSVLQSLTLGDYPDALCVYGWRKPWSLWGCGQSNNRSDCGWTSLNLSSTEVKLNCYFHKDNCGFFSTRETHLFSGHKLTYVSSGSEIPTFYQHTIKRRQRHVLQANWDEKEHFWYFPKHPFSSVY